MLVLLLIVSMFALVVAEDLPDAGFGAGGEDVENIQGAIDDYSPLDEDGSVNVSKYRPFMSKAEMRIAGINMWLEENASWLKIVFGMVPSISWLFAINFYILLWFIVVLVLNGDATFGFLGFLGKKIDIAVGEVSWAQIFGFVIFAILLITKVFANLAILLTNLIGFLWNKVLPVGVAAAIVAMIIVGIVLVVLLMFAPQVLLKIKIWLDEKRKKKAADKEAANREVLEKIVEGATRE